MEKKPLTRWEDFEQALVEIKKMEVLQKERQSWKRFLLFRGVGASGSKPPYLLESTLDRIQNGMSFSDYLRIIKCVHKHVATCTGKKWDLQTEEPKLSLGEFNLPVSTYEFMAYLRHNGFPSPLMDWTKSPYIAAFFAFRDLYPETRHEEYVSIFVYRGNIQCGQNPCFYLLGPTIATSPTHYLQQSWYSICVTNKNGRIYFANHEDVKQHEEQDVLIKYDIPVSEQQKVLRKLDSMNITAYSLFNSETSLMETLALREIVSK